MKKWSLVVATAAVMLLAAGCTVPGIDTISGSDQSSTIASEIGVSECWQTVYEIENRLSGDSDSLYNCTMRNGSSKCVTYSGGIAHDETDSAKYLFDDNLSGGRPPCST